MADRSLELDVLFAFLESIEADRSIGVAVRGGQTLFLQIDVVHQTAVVGTVAA